MSLAAPCLATAQTARSEPVIERAWFGPADRAHGHDALGTGRCPSRLHAAIRARGRQHTVTRELPEDTAFEDSVIRWVSMDAGSSPGLLLVRASRSAGAALSIVTAGSASGTPVLLERARSPSVGAGRWLNPVGAADFDGDGRQQVVAVLTPHIGGILTLYRYQPPDLIPVAQERDVSNHVYGQQEQQLAAVITRGGHAVVAVPDQSRRRLRFLKPAPNGRWASAAPDLAFEHPIERLWTPGGNQLHARAGMRVWQID